jgi:hypothetical protein
VRLSPAAAARLRSFGIFPAAGKSRAGAARPAGTGVAELDRVLAEVHRLHPIAGARASGDGMAWTFARPVPWPLFLRLELAKPFHAAAAELCAALADVSVEEFALRGGKAELRVRG